MGRFNRRHKHGVLRKKFARRQMKARARKRKVGGGLRVSAQRRLGTKPRRR